MAAKPTDIHMTGVALYFLPVETRVPLKFGPETLTYVTCARAKITVTDANGNTVVGWGETPLSVQWVWPSSLGYEERHEALKAFTVQLAEAWQGFETAGDPMSVGFAFQETVLPKLLKDFNDSRGGEAMPWLGALVCCSAFDIALHDAFGNLLGKSVYETYTAEYMNHDLSHFIEPADGADVSFAGKYPADFFVADVPKSMPAWHLVGGKDLIDPEELTGEEPQDGYPVLLRDWIRTHGMTLMVQDLTNPMLAQIPHCLLAAYAGTIMGVETNAMQFYPAASEAEEKVHPGLYKRR
jgi:hypothetical protein